MPKTAIETKQLSASEKALFSYLDEMLREGTESPAAAIDVPVETVQTHEPSVESLADTSTDTPRKAIARTTPTLPVVTVNVDEPAREPIKQDLVLAPAVEDEVVAPGARVPPVVGWQDNGRPSWAQSRFDALLFKVAGLKLAVPLVSLGLIHPIDKKFNALPHQTPWFLGLLRVSGGASIKVIDTAMCVMPERYTPACREGLKYVITLHGYEWGLACHEVDKAISLDPDTINWRTQRGKRPWMAGTVREHMCALIDSTGFHNVIEAVTPPKDSS